MSIAAGLEVEPPYYAVIFTSTRTPGDQDAYAETAKRMIDLAASQPGFLGVDSVRDGIGITVSYWRDEASIGAWRRQVEHLLAQAAGRDRWYERYSVRIARVERAYAFARDGNQPLSPESPDCP
jgi:heme-degrading monooxygenase HmoA